MSARVLPLQGAQAQAVEPGDSVWLSASAGTGKTQVLSARVLRLLLSGVDPSQILCLTFTKAGAAEMAVRVNGVLAGWVRMPDELLARQLSAINAPIDPATRERARSLFTRVLDTPGGGLRIDTIHAFAQYLLAAFPGEADVLPGARPMEDRERDLLARDVLSDLLATASPAMREALADISRRKGPDAVAGWLMRCTRHAGLWDMPFWQGDLTLPIRRMLGMPSDADTAWVAALCGDAAFPVAALRRAQAAAKAWGAPTGIKAAQFADAWLATDDIGRAETIGGFYETFLVKAGTPRKMDGATKADPDFPVLQDDIAAAVAAVVERRSLLSVAEGLVPQLEAGRAFARLWDDAKAREGLIDFDDLIRRAADLLSRSTMADWIRYKLDRSFDHILVDEAQDTNAAQWAIVKALTDDYFDGLGAGGETVRTIFTVGDYKQAIFGFQGTSPENFRQARDYYADRIASGALPEGDPPRRLAEYGLDRSYRTNRTVLDFVDRAIDALGYEALGLDRRDGRHVGDERPGRVMLWRPVRVVAETDEPEPGEGSGDAAEGEGGWLPRHDREMADRLARQIACWLDPDGPGFTLVKGGARRARAGDIMVLVQARRELAALIVARLYTHGVPVAGVDRLRLGNPLAVKDLMAALRFAAQPLDDLQLANLLVSPLIGWSQDDLLAHAVRPRGVALWEHLREHADSFVQGTVDALRQILNRADFDSPQELLHWLLVGPLDGRRRLVARLGREANDPIDELLNAAGAYAATHVASLQGFIRWFDAGDGELKREAGEGGDQVRVMTVHGSKGLQAPIVILADAANAPKLDAPLALPAVPGDEAQPTVPVPGLTTAERVGPLAVAAEKAAAAAIAEHWRLLYVAMTRAEEALCIGGALGPRDARRGPHADSWFARLEALFDGEMIDDPIWGGRFEIGEAAYPVAVTPAVVEPADALPDWALRPVGAEPRPPRPLAPSGLGEVEGSDPPLPSDLAAGAARRGVLIHSLLERLPDVAVPDRQTAGARWLERQAADLSAGERGEMLERALAVLADPRFADVFGDGALAEVPLAATVAGQVVLGTADRLLIQDNRVRVVDYKTARRPPATVGDISEATLRQMAAYVAALEVIYPGRTVEAAVLYTQTPELMILPGEVLAPFKAGLGDAKEALLPSPVE